MTVQQSMFTKLTEAFDPISLDVINESHMHNVPPGSESHFKVVLVTESFQEMNLVKRHQSVYKALAEFLTQGVHALALHTYTSEEWQAKNGAPESPECLGGSKKG